LRTQQIIAYESGVADTVDPLGGSYFIESLTDSVEEAARRVMHEIEAVGGAVAAIEAGVVQRMIEDSAYREARRVEAGESVVVGVNRFVEEAGSEVPAMVVDHSVEEAQSARLAALRSERDARAVESALDDVRTAAAGDVNLLYPMKTALLRNATLGEVSAALADVFGRYRPGS
jgi:methylmalonyl-CoA mutase N-terminal domain/subunit